MSEEPFAGLPYRLQAIAGLQAEIDAAGMGDPLKRENAELRTENERLRAQMTAHRETAVAAIAGSEKEVERLTEAYIDLKRRFELLYDDDNKLGIEVRGMRDAYDDCWREIKRLRAAILAYDDEIRAVAHLGQRWVEDDKLDDLYVAMVTAAGRDIES